MRGGLYVKDTNGVGRICGDEDNINEGCFDDGKFDAGYSWVYKFIQIKSWLSKFVTPGRYQLMINKGGGGYKERQV